MTPISEEQVLQALRTLSQQAAGADRRGDVGQLDRVWWMVQGVATVLSTAGAPVEAVVFEVARLVQADIDGRIRSYDETGAGLQGPSIL